MQFINDFFSKPGSKGIFIGGFILVFILATGIFAEGFSPHDPTQQFLARRLTGPSHDFPLGTDALGRCVLSRIIHGIRPTLGLSLAVALTLPGWPKYARVVRIVALSLKERTFMQAAEALGAGRGYILRRYYLPAVLAPVFTIATIGVGGKIVYIAGMGVLGLGVQPPIPEWGSLLCKGLPLLAVAPHISLCSGAAIVLTSAAFILSGEGLRDFLDPKGKDVEITWRN